MRNYEIYKPFRRSNRKQQRPSPTIVSLVMGLMITLIIVVLTSSCVSTKKYNAVLEAKDAAETQIAKLKVDQTFDEYDQATELYEKQNTIFQKDQALLDKSKQLDELKHILHLQKKELAEANQVVSNLSNQEWSVDEINGQLKLNLDASLIFPLNSSELTPEGEKLLNNLAQSIDSLDPKVQVRIVGHTDNQPFDHPNYDNWDLSADRALAVARSLQIQGIDPALISAMARSEFDPRASNNSEKGRMLNRRVEVQLIPVGALNQTVSELLTNKS